MPYQGCPQGLRAPPPARYDFHQPVRAVTSSGAAVEPRRSPCGPSRHEPSRQPERWFLSGCYRNPEEDLGPGGLDPGGDQPAAVAVEGDTVGRLVDVDADVDRLALLEAQGRVRCADDLELAGLGVRHGQYLRSETRESPTQVCAPNGSSAFMLSIPRAIRAVPPRVRSRASAEFARGIRQGA